MNWIDYREKLGIAICDNQKGIMLSNKIYNYIMRNFCDEYAEDDLIDYCMMVGERYKFYGNYTQQLVDSILSSNTIKDLIAKFIAFHNTYNRSNCYCFDMKQEILKFLLNTLDELKIQYEVVEDTDGTFIFPKGAKELDDALISEPLEWLKEYPQTRKEWIEALKDYSDLTYDNASDVADKFRKALERFFQEFFSKAQSLENLKSEYGTYLKTQGVPAEISNNFEWLLQSYAKYMNEYAKHHDKTNKNVLEYIMYQTGNIIRLLITLRKGENN